MTIKIRTDDEPMLVIAHRGACLHAPENTLPSFLRARELGATWVETDVKRSRDGTLVLMHDRTVDRTTNGTGAVHDLSLSEIRSLDAGAWFGSRYAGTLVPTLEELITWASTADMGVCLDLGGGLMSADLAVIGEMLRHSNTAGRVLAICRDMDVLSALRGMCSEVTIGLLYSEDHDTVLARAQSVQLDFLHPHRHLVSPDLIQNAHAAGFPVAASVDSSAALIDERRRWGLDVVNCDDPGLCR